MSQLSHKDRLFHEILMARERVYEACKPTPLEPLELHLDAKVFLKREDYSPINSFKWRGAYNRIATLTDEEKGDGVVAASAGNHAQGVALAARQLGLHAKIYMPKSTPKMKQIAVRRHGGAHVDVVLEGDAYDDAANAAKTFANETNRVFVHAYDDYYTMGGQGTLADEAIMAGHGRFDVAYLQIGGGGIAAAVACWLKKYHPDTRIVGVEGVDQASMWAAVQAGKPVELEYVDVFCDGTAVKKVGKLTHALCAELVDEFIQVTNEEVCAAIELLWKERRCIAEPSGAMGLAGLMKQAETLGNERALCILCGSNMDFEKLAWVSGHAAIGAARRRYLRCEIDERPGSFLDLIDNILEGVNIIDFQYGKINPDKAWPVVGFEASPAELDLLHQRFEEHGIRHEDVTSKEDVEFRIIHYNSSLFKNSFFFTLEFPERAGALQDFLTHIAELKANMCYFNYAYSGESVGRALLGFEVESDDERQRFIQHLTAAKYTFHEIDAAVLSRML